ncbi:hypothetical protein G7K_3831-t1 [Saitoella complicata NRRL Y-17804]|uniref:Uncharacterized protein n=1 Tax=Saitoella complicata (strain BCRC 22490 / CBS 7301 / JCM 7358 / NBRC 10748 / NRRL Y-17804) TaxID=698492 RepID=A0A0E9NJV2_SAICN|nr:hypothetical protein G7K_3831-t1 [Saitoella complicata NRRL Y-17804]
MLMQTRLCDKEGRQEGQGHPAIFFSVPCPPRTVPDEFMSKIDDEKKNEKVRTKALGFVRIKKECCRKGAAR